MPSSLIGKVVRLSYSLFDTRIFYDVYIIKTYLEKDKVRIYGTILNVESEGQPENYIIPPKSELKTTQMFWGYDDIVFIKSFEEYMAEII